MSAMNAINAAVAGATILSPSELLGCDTGLLTLRSLRGGKAMASVGSVPEDTPQKLPE